MSDPPLPIRFDVAAFFAAERFRIHFGDRDPKERELRGSVRVPGDDRPAHVKVPAPIELSRFFRTSPDARRTSRNVVVTPEGNVTGSNIATAAVLALQATPEPSDTTFEALSTWRRASYKPDAEFLRHLSMAAGVVIRTLPLAERKKRASGNGMSREERNARHRENVRCDEWGTATWALLEYVFCPDAMPGAPIDVDVVIANGDRLVAAWSDYIGEDEEFFVEDFSRYAIPPTPPRAFSRQRLFEVFRALGIEHTDSSARRTVAPTPERELFDMSTLPVLSRDEILETLVRLAIDADPARFGAEAEGVDITVRMKHGGKFTVSQDAPTDTEADNLRRASERIKTVLVTGPLSAGRLRNKVARSIRDYADEAMEALEASGVIVADTDANGIVTYSLAP
ncbi:hypothetical protein G5C66_07760 [Nocardioides sp. KC13]|uniref:Uncharacterized protein n=1 Tax=Nocardioides turkmenicus TaxID=2711220 RepID=A0A6M1QXL8_9ACTN|nr:hypothetical protein [Nocardioides sp. KC13]NGN92634.1 hypothetical protein [Nocardioides sp. KC13]